MHGRGRGSLGMLPRTHGKTESTEEQTFCVPASYLSRFRTFHTALFLDILSGVNALHFFASAVTARCPIRKVSRDSSAELHNPFGARRRGQQCPEGRSDKIWDLISVWSIAGLGGAADGW